MKGELSSVDGVVQAHHDLIGTGGVRLHRVGCGGVQNGLPLFREDDAVEAVGVAGAVDLLDAFTLLFGSLCDVLHQGGFAAARPAFDEIELHPRFVPQRLKIALEPGGRGGSEEKIDRIGPDVCHKEHLTFVLEYAKQKESVTERELV